MIDDRTQPRQWWRSGKLASILRAWRAVGRAMVRSERRFDVALVVLQLAAISSVLAFVLAGLWLYRHQTGDYFLGPVAFFASVKVAVPPIGALIGSYMIAFVAGVQVQDSPKLVLRFLRNRFFQDRAAMLVATAIMSAATFCAVVYTERTTPPEYERLLSHLLGGESDDFVIVDETLKGIGGRNPKLASQLTSAVEVFRRRAQANFQKRAVTATEARILARSLSANIDERWAAHPLRKHALAEAYSLWMAQVRGAEQQDLLAKVVDLYRSVESSTDPLAPALLRSSAANNAGNAFLYAEQLERAKEQMARTLWKYPNLATWGNLVAVMVMLGEPTQAIDEAVRAQDWALKENKALIDIANYAGIVGNRAFAHLVVGNFSKAVDDSQASYDLVADELSRIQLVIAETLTGDAEAASVALKGFKLPPLTPENQAERVREPLTSACAYFGGAIAANPTSFEGALNMLVYLGEARTPQQLERLGEQDIATLRRQTWNALQKDGGPCGYYSLIPAIRDLFVPTERGPRATLSND